jgi:hypothetical protein
MTKTEIKTQLEANGTLHVTKSQDPLWKQAFDMYNRENRQQLKISCGGCWPKVKEWLLK